MKLEWGDSVDSENYKNPDWEGQLVDEVERTDTERQEYATER